MPPNSVRGVVMGWGTEIRQVNMMSLSIEKKEEKCSNFQLLKRRRRRVVEVEITGVKNNWPSRVHLLVPQGSLTPLEGHIVTNHLSSRHTLIENVGIPQHQHIQNPKIFQTMGKKIARGFSSHDQDA